MPGEAAAEGTLHARLGAGFLSRTLQDDNNTDTPNHHLSSALVDAAVSATLWNRYLGVYVAVGGQLGFTTSSGSGRPIVGVAQLGFSLRTASRRFVFSLGPCLVAPLGEFSLYALSADARMEWPVEETKHVGVAIALLQRLPYEVERGWVEYTSLTAGVIAGF